MTRLFLFFIVTIASVGSFAQPPKDAYGKPLIVFTEENPWLMVIGSDTPTFVLYENGQIIYKHLEGKTVTVYETRVSSEKLNSFIEGLGISSSFYDLPERVVASNWTDQPSNVLRVNLSKPKTVFVYGNLRASTKPGDMPMPDAIRAIFSRLINFSEASATVWSPTTVEVMFWDFDYAKNKVAWPKGLPDLTSKSTVKFAGGMYSVFLSQEQFPDFRKFCDSVGEKTAVEINGKKMAMSFRYPFPNIH